MYYNKVEICGINTSSLPVLSEEEKLGLLQRIRGGDQTARAQMISGNLRLVLSVVQKFTSHRENLDDIFQVGCVGLIKAIDNFDPTLMVKFSTYGVPMILGEIRRYLRDNNMVRVSRSMRDTAYRAMQTREALQSRDNREPSVNQIAREMGCRKEDVVLALEAIVEPGSLYDPVYTDGRDTIYVMDQVRDTNTDSDWLDEISLRQALTALSDREKRILSLRFLTGKTQIEVSREVGISQAQVSRIEKGALQRIKSQI